MRKEDIGQSTKGNKSVEERMGKEEVKHYNEK